MATVKQYETLVKKIANTTSEDERASLVNQKRDVLDALRKTAGGNHDKRRKLKTELDEANNS